jgi:hypothetical protein
MDESVKKKREILRLTFPFLHLFDLFNPYWSEP